MGFDLPQDMRYKGKMRRLRPLTALQVSDCFICVT